MNKERQLLKTLLKKNNYFITTPRLELFDVLQKHNALTIPRLISSIPQHHQATAYRNIKIFEELGIVNRLRLGWNSKLELSDIFKHHHHHLSCISCGRVIILRENPVIESEIANLAKKRKFKPTDHQLEVRGLCDGCQKST